MNQDILERLDFIEFRQQLLFSNDDISRLLFEHEITKEQYRRILDYFEELRTRSYNGEEISSVEYESTIYNIAPHKYSDYHFAEGFAQTLYEDGRYQEVFEGLYSDSPKFRSYFENK